MRTFQSILALTLMLSATRTRNVIGVSADSESGLLDSGVVNLKEQQVQESSAGVIPHRTLQSGVADCTWDGVQCSLRKDFVKILPSILGVPTTDSAKTLGNAALRAAVCSNFTDIAECLSYSSYSCDWDAALNECTLADVLDIEALRGVAFCPNSLLDVAMNCFSLSTSGCIATATTTTNINCTLLDRSELGWSPGGGSSSLDSSMGSSALSGLESDRQLSAVLTAVLSSLIKYGMAGTADSILQLVSGLVGRVGRVSESAATEDAPQICGPSWMVDSETMSSLGADVTRAIGTNQDLLSALLNEISLPTTTSSDSSSFSSCTNENGTVQPPLLLVAARECAAASQSAAACAAAQAPGGCQWVGMGALGACTVAPGLLPALTLDASDRWVTIFNNATAICRSLTDSSSCAAAVDIAGGLNQQLDGSEFDSGYRFGGGGDGGAATAASASWWLLAAATAAAVALGDAVRRYGV